MQILFRFVFAVAPLMTAFATHSQTRPIASPGTGVVPGTYTCPILTIDAAGRITAAADGPCPTSGSSPGRTVMTADKTFYYSCVTGSNANPGTIEAPFADPAHAYKIDQQTLDHAGQYVTYVRQIGHCSPPASTDPISGVQASWLFIGPLVGAIGVDSFRIVGEDTGTVIYGAAGGYVFSSHRDAAYTTSNLNCVPGGGGGCWLSDNSPLVVENVRGETNGGNSLIDAAGPRAVVVAKNVVLSAMGEPMNIVVVMEDGAWAHVTGEWIMNGGPAFTTFVQADIASVIDLTGFRSKGEALGARANAIMNGVIFTNTKGIAILPGSKDGVADSGGQIH